VGKSNRPDIETSGITARFYDQLVFLGTFGLYQRLLRLIIKHMSIQAQDHILDMGAGTGKNALLMHQYLNGGSITALEIGKEMRRQFKRKCGEMNSITLENRRIEEPLPYENRFDKVFISYVLHGFEQNSRETILRNAHRSLKSGGRLFILDWNEFDLSQAGLFMRFFMNNIECSPARDFIKHDVRELLRRAGFSELKTELFIRDRIRLISGGKQLHDQ
jgi:demethylmenaquinone methyltransferase/2-methoxy-6-polyprenyl-1,4-benzoquinol methylase